MAESESGQEKTEQPTPKRLEKAKQDGQVARSRELNTTAVVIAGVLSLLFLGAEVGARLKEVMQVNFSLPRAAAFDTHIAIGMLYSSADVAFTALIPIFLVLIVAALLTPMLLGGWLLSAKAMAPKFSRMNPLKGFQKMFSMNALVELGKAIAKFVLIAGIAILLLNLSKDQLLTIGHQDPAAAIADSFEIILMSVIFISLAMLVISAIDVPYQMFDHAKKLKMTRQEVKDEQKDTEGKPEVKSRIRQVQRELAQRRMMEAVPEADVVITNPDHFSVALKYAVGDSGAPIVLAKGADHVAIKIREIANKHEVEIISSPTLCRAIYFTTDIGKEIPSALYEAVARVLAYVFQLKAYRSYRGGKPKPIDDLDVPDNMNFATDGKISKE